MGRGYWLPPSAENLVACDGFYIDAAAIYTTDPYGDWGKFLNTLCVKLSYREKTLQRICAWKACSAGQRRFVVLQNHHVDIVADDACGYVAVYVIIPEDCQHPGFAKRSFPYYVSLLKKVLIDMYPGSIKKRLNSQHTKSVG